MLPLVPSAPGTAAPSSASRGVALGPVVLFAALYAFAAASVVRPVLDEDLGWHLGVGRWVAEHGNVPDVDPLQATGQARPWVAYSWLFEWLLYGLYTLLGLPGVLLYRAVLGLALVASLHRFLGRREPRPLPAFALLGAAVVALVPLLTERPWLVTLLFSLWTLDIVLDLRDGRPARGAAFLPALFAVWANVHIQFVYGLLLLGLACVVPGRRPWRLLAACALATLVNPYHVRLYGVVWDYATQPGPYRVIHELTALGFRDTWDWAVLGLALAAAFALGRRPRLPLFELLLLGGSAYLSFRSRRDLWVVTFAALAVLTSPRRPAAGVPLPFRVALAGWGAVVVLALVGLRGLGADGLARAVEAKFPVRAVAAIRDSGHKGPLMAPMAWGGYLLWALPDVPANIDGRTNLHGDARLLRLEQTWAGLPGWRDDPELRAARLVVAHPRLALTELLRRDPDFATLHEDDVAVVFVRR